MITPDAGALIERMFARHMLAHNYRIKPVSGSVTAVNTRNNLMDVASGVSGVTKVGIPHPFQSPNAWIRAYPEPGATVLTHERAEDPYPVSLGYYRDSPISSESDLTNLTPPVGRYRNMVGGEIDIASIGLGESYWSSRGVVEHRSVLITERLDWDRFETKGRSGTFIRQHFDNILSPVPPVLLHDEERFGYIKRAQTSPVFEKFVPTTPFYFGPGLSWGKEYVRIIHAKPAFATPISPLKVIDIREGTTVINDLGIPEPIGATALPGPLRFDHQYFTVPQADSFRVSMNLLGQVGIQLPLTASFPNALTLQIPTGGAVVQIAQQLNLTCGLGVNLGAGAAVSISAGLAATVSAATTAKIIAPAVTLGAGAVEANPVQAVIRQGDLVLLNFEAIAAAMVAMLISPAGALTLTGVVTPPATGVATHVAGSTIVTAS